jgi:prephenate dehydrogenase (NADP+)
MKGLAIMNPSARIQITQYAKSVADLFKLMIQEKEEEFRNRIREVCILNSFDITSLID